MKLFLRPWRLGVECFVYPSALKKAHFFRGVPQRTGESPDGDDSWLNSTLRSSVKACARHWSLWHVHR
ncbi:hypothetical protein MPC4_10413 [Methylocella tundrae]|uniref:Uncharacterized protein n=1 Tax=Methylocella tundrae TaxID=227605 RepID=A0A8B6M0V7_METTU|nr:hypothetical protein MPC1_1000003 [Methylocella tundrae]VTZ48458.1 hypothetical protein MPC4_10413 [Methylocella tundrae]